MENKQTTNIDEFLKIYSTKKLEVIDESFHVRNFYDGLCILTDYPGFDLILKSVKSRIVETEKEIAALYLGFNLASEQIEFLLNNNDALKRIIKEQKLSSFKLGENKTQFIDFSILCNGRSEEILKQVRPCCWDDIYSLLIDLQGLETIYNKMKDAAADDYIEDLEEIKEVVAEDYSKLDLDNLENCSKEFNMSNDEVLSRAIRYSEKHKLEYNDAKIYLIKYFSPLVMMTFALVNDIKGQIKDNK